jgi:response regulator RpfG family c-di-GMP phosphodiesterase
MRIDPELRGRVEFFHTALAPALAARATLLSLSPAERSEARARMPPLPPPPPRKMRTPGPDAPFTVLLLNVDEDAQASLRRIFRERSRHVLRSSIAEAGELALTAPFDLVISGHRSAVFQDGLLDYVARVDREGADRIIVLAPTRDVHYARWQTSKRGRVSPIVALPIDEALLAKEAFTRRPDLRDRSARADIEREAEAEPVIRKMFRRPTVLVVDEQIETEIFFASEPSFASADVIFAKSTMDALVAATSRTVDLLLCASSMRGDGGEPFYRVLWRLAPALKTRTVIITASEALPLSSPPSTRPRILERPLRADAIQRVIDAYTS